MLEREREKGGEEEGVREGRRSRPLTIAIDDSIENIELCYNIREDQLARESGKRPRRDRITRPSA